MFAPQEADDIAKRGVRWKLELVGLWNAQSYTAFLNAIRECVSWGLVYRI